MPNVVVSLGARLAASVAHLVTRRPPPGEIKSSRTGPLIAFEHLHQPVWSPRDYTAFANEGFMQNPIVYRCVRMIAECSAHIPLLLYDGDQEIEHHPLRSLLHRPNANETWPDFMQRLVGFLLVSGNAYIEAVAIPGADATWASEAPGKSADASAAQRGSATTWASEAPQIRELHLLRPDRVKVVPGADGWPEAFDYTVAGRTIRIGGEVVAAEPHEGRAGVRTVLHVKLFHPSNDHYGLSPLEAAASAIDLHNTAARWNKALLDNSARPSGAIVYTARDGNLTGEQIERLKSELEAGFQGSANAGRPLLLEGGLDWKAMSLSPKDMDFIEARHVAAREIALALGVPPMLLGIPGDNTYSNLAEAQRTFWRATVLPLVERVAGALSGWLSPAYAPAAGRQPTAYEHGVALELRPNLDDLPALAPEREALWASLEKTSFLSIDEKRVLAGFSPTPDTKRRDAKFNPSQPAPPPGKSADGQCSTRQPDSTRLSFTAVPNHTPLHPSNAQPPDCRNPSACLELPHDAC